MATPNPSYTVRTVNMDGTIIAEVTDARVRHVRRQLNDPGSFSIVLPITSPSLAQIQLTRREIQILRDGVILFWGVPTFFEQSSATGEVVVQGENLLWYFKRRFVGPPGYVNYLEDGDFEVDAAGTSIASMTHWDQSSVDGAPGSGSVSNFIAVYPTRSLKLEDLGAGGANRDRYMYQRINVADHPELVGHTIWVRAWCYVSEAGFTGPAAWNRGLFAEIADAGSVYTYNSSTIDVSHPRGSWVRHETSVVVDPAKPNSVIEIRLYLPGGTIYWDAVVATTEWSEGAQFFTLDESFADLINHAQDSAYGKSDLNIDPNMTAVTALTYDDFFHYDHERFWDIFQTFTQREDGFDFDLDWVYTGATAVRRITNYSPQKGAAKPAQAMSWAAGTMLAYRWAEDGSQRATHITAVSEYVGPTRENGSAEDLFATAPYFEEVLVAPPGFPINFLDAWAEQHLRYRKNPTPLPIITTVAEGFIGNLDTGDTTMVTVQEGLVDYNASLRVAAFTLDAERDVIDWEFTLP